MHQLDIGTTVTEDFEIVSVTLDNPGMRQLLVTIVYKGRHQNS